MFDKTTIKIGLGLAAIMVVLIPPKIFGDKIDTKSPILSGIITSFQPKDSIESKPEFIGDIGLPKLTAKSVLVMDLGNHRGLYAMEIDQKLPIASLTKLMTAMIVADNVNRDLLVTVEKSDTAVSGSKMYLLDGEVISVKNLLDGLLIPSGNDAAKALARITAGGNQKFVEMMNKKAQILGLTDTHFANPIGLDDPNNYSTAQDLVILTEEFMKYAMLAEIVATRSLTVMSADGNIKHELVSSNKLLLENSEVVGVKTGYTAQALGNLIVKINRGNAQILTIVLNTPNREEDTQKLIDWIFQVYKW